MLVLKFSLFRVTNKIGKINPILNVNTTVIQILNCLTFLTCWGLFWSTFTFKYIKNKFWIRRFCYREYNQIVKINPILNSPKIKVGMSTSIWWLSPLSDGRLPYLMSDSSTWWPSPLPDGRLLYLMAVSSTWWPSLLPRWPSPLPDGHLFYLMANSFTWWPSPLPDGRPHLPDGCLQDAGQVVRVELAGGLAQLSLQQVQQVPHDVALRTVLKT